MNLRFCIFSYLFFRVSLAQSLPKFPNIGYLGQGYDLLYGNPQSMDLSSDPGFRTAIYNLTYSGQETPDGKYQVPDGTQVLNCTTCFWSFNVDQMSGVQGYSQSISKSVTANYTGIVMAFGLSSSYQYMLKTVSTQGHLYTKAVALCTVYCASVLTYTPPKLSANFMAGVQAIPTIPNDDANLEWIAEFGTHVLQQATMGGVFGQQTEFDRQSWAILENQQEVSGFSISAAASYSAITLAGGFNTLTSEQQTQATLFRNMAYNQFQIVFGGLPPANGSVPVWQTSVTSNPMPVSWKLLDITSLFTTDNFPNISPTDLLAKQTNIRSTIKNYCQLLLAQGLTTTCSPPSDPTFPPPAKACYRKTSQYGGTGGKVFDDELPPTSSAQVTTVRIDLRAADVVDFIQLTIDDGISSIPLKGHGGGGGQAYTFMVPPGDFICRILIWITNYIGGIQFVTAGGVQSRIYGRELGTLQVLNFNITSKENPASLFGRSDKYVDAIGFYLESPCLDGDYGSMP